MEFITPEEHITSKSRSTTVVGVIIALFLTAAVTAGYFIIRKRYAEAERQRSIAAAPTTAPAKAQQSPVVEVQEDQAMLRGSQALVGGVVTNIGQSELKGLAIELALSPRKGGAEERRAVPLSPKDITPGQSAKYSTLVSRDFRSFRIVQIVEGNGAGSSLAFKTLPGKRRPLEGAPEPKTVIVKKPRPKNGEEEFINTPDNPSTVP